jgi:hypothetical protein
MLNGRLFFLRVDDSLLNLFANILAPVAGVRGVLV